MTRFSQGDIMNWTNGVLRMLPTASLLLLALASGPAFALDLPAVTGAQIDVLAPTP